MGVTAVIAAVTRLVSLAPARGNAIVETGGEVCPVEVSVLLGEKWQVAQRFSLQ